MGKGFKFLQKVQTRYSDFDMMLHLNNAAYVAYFELARYKYFTDALKIQLEEAANVVASIRIEYKVPVLEHHVLAILVKTTSIGNKSFVMDYQLVSETDHDMIFATAQTVQVCIDHQSGKAVLIPEVLRTRISEFEAL